MWKSKIKILLVILRCFGSALKPVEIRQSLNKGHSHLKRGEKVKDGLVKMIWKVHCGKKSGEKVIHIGQPTVYDLFKAICPWEFASFCFRHVFLQAFLSQWVSFAVQLISQQINNQIKVLMWKHISQSSISMFSLARHFACCKERKKKKSTY